MHRFTVCCSNRYFWQRIAVVAETDAGARALALELANNALVLTMEARGAAAIGEESGGAYIVDEVECDGEADSARSRASRITWLLDAGGNGGAQ